MMIIDDEPIVGKRLSRMFERDGYEVETFIDSEAASMELENKTYEIIITDLKMQNVDGIRILETAVKKNPDTKVIIITGFGRKETAKEAFRKGAFAFIIKPFKLEELRQVIRRAENEIRNFSSE